jgi:tRNA threonylcarbamoyladenosine dehydratase
LTNGSFFWKRKVARLPEKRIFAQSRIASSVGLEHYFDRVGVAGSSPAQSTTENHSKAGEAFASPAFVKKRPMSIPYWMSRTQLLLGDEPVKALMDKNVLVVGLGGVGGICAEMIARAGVGRMTIVDADVVDLSNCNRQVPALHSTAGMGKAEVMAQRMKDINPAIELTVLPEYLRDERTFEVLDQGGFDYAVDCIDTLSPKVYFIKGCIERKIPVVSSLGAGGKVDPLQVTVTDISKTYQCNLARYVRKRLHEQGIYKGLTVVFSPERADQSRIIETEKAHPKKSIIGTISYMPAIFGCMAASVVIRGLYNGAGSDL